MGSIDFSIYWIFLLLRLVGMIYVMHILVLCIRNINWYQLLVIFIGGIYVYYIWQILIGNIYWYVFAIFIGTIHW